MLHAPRVRNRLNDGSVFSYQLEARFFCLPLGLKLGLTHFFFVVEIPEPCMIVSDVRSAGEWDGFTFRA